MNLVSNPFFSLTKEVVEDCLVKEELDRLRSEDEDRGSRERHYHLLTEFHQEQKDIVQAMNVIELLESVQGAKLIDRGAGNGIVKPIGEWERLTTTDYYYLSSSIKIM